MTLGIKRGKHVSDKEAEAQVFYHKFKKRSLESKAFDHQLHIDNAKEITEMGKKLEFWKHHALIGE